MAASYNERTFPSDFDLEIFSQSNGLMCIKLFSVQEMLAVGHLVTGDGVVLAHYKQPRVKAHRVDLESTPLLDARLRKIRCLQMTDAEIARFVANFANRGAEYQRVLTLAARTFLNTGYLDAVSFENVGSYQHGYVAARKLRLGGGSERVGTVALKIVADNETEMWRRMCAMYDIVDMLEINDFVRHVTHHT